MALLSDNQLRAELQERLLPLNPQQDEVENEWELITQGLLTEAQLLQHYIDLSQLPAQDEENNFSPEKMEEFNAEYLEEHCLLPLSLEDKTLEIAVSEPYNLGQIALNFRALFGLRCKFLLLRRSVIERKLTELYRHSEMHELEGSSEQSLKDLAREAPIVRLVNDIFARAAELGASDIHVEPSEASLAIRYRIDGVLDSAFTPPLNQYAAIASRLKLIGGLNIAEHRLPQDGRIELTIGGKRIDVRMSTLPGMYGESIVMRLLQKDAVNFTLANIGMQEKMIENFSREVKRPHGLILVVGPTGSGKTTTLYCVLNLINTGKQKIITVEDPIEYQVDGITQVQVKAAIGLTFASGLRSIVRQDPDIILVGEIRDRETADICINAALTGHLVFSTLHTNDAAGAISRLQEMGVENFLIASALTAVMSQRLVRRSCSPCEGTGLSSGDERCRPCAGSGYKGRVGIYELLLVSDSIRKKIIASADSGEIHKLACNEGMLTISEDGIAKAQSGLTSEAEIHRVCNQ